MVPIPLELLETYIKQFDRPLYQVCEEAREEAWRRVEELEGLYRSALSKIKELEFQMEKDRVEKENVKEQFSRYFGQ